MKHKTRDFKESIYNDVVRITKEDKDFIDKIRGKKSKAGMLREIIKKYRNERL